MITNLLSNLKWLHVFVAALAYFLLGAIWYSNVLFAKPWQKFVKADMSNPDAKKGLGAIMFASFLLMFLACIGLGIAYQLYPIFDVMHAIKFGIFYSACFGVPVMSVSFLYEKRPLGLHLINAGYNIAGFIIASIILVMWK